MLHFDAQPRRIAVLRPGQSAPVLVYNAPEDHRPFLHPWTAPDGIGCLTEDAPPHHPWQHGLYVGLNRVNEIGFWTEGKTGSDTDGTFHPDPIASPVRTRARVTWAVRVVWRDPAGEPLLVEYHTYNVSERGAGIQIDFDWTLSTSREITFGQYAYGGLFLRMPWRPDAGGVVLTSAGHTSPGDADQQRARWVAVALECPALAGVAILDHPSNPEHPVPWRVDGQLGIGPSPCIAGDVRLPYPGRIANRYRLLSFTGAPDRDALDNAWKEFAGC